MARMACKSSLMPQSNLWRNQVTLLRIALLYLRLHMPDQDICFGSPPAVGVVIHSAANCPEKGICIDSYFVGDLQWFAALGDKANPKMWPTLHHTEYVLCEMSVGILLICGQTFMFGRCLQKTKWLCFQIQSQYASALDWCPEVWSCSGLFPILCCAVASTPCLAS